MSTSKDYRPTHPPVRKRRSDLGGSTHRDKLIPRNCEVLCLIPVEKDIDVISTKGTEKIL